MDLIPILNKYNELLKSGDDIEEIMKLETKFPKKQKTTNSYLDILNHMYNLTLKITNRDTREEFRSIIKGLIDKV